MSLQGSPARCPRREHVEPRGQRSPRAHGRLRGGRRGYAGPPNDGG